MKALREFIIRLFLKAKPKGVMTALPNKDLVDMNIAIVAEKLMRNGIDPNSLKNANQVENAIRMIDDRPKVQEGITATKSAKIMDMEGKEIDPRSRIMGGKQAETNAEIKARLEKSNKEGIARIRNKKMVKDAVDNVSPGFVKGDRKYNAQLVAEDLADKKFGKDFYDLDQKQQNDLYGEALDGLSVDLEDFATGGRAGFANGGEGLMSLADKQKASLGPGAPSIKYDFDREGPGPMGPPFETDDPEEAAREIVRRLIRIEGAQIPISKKGQLGIAIPKLDTVGAGGLINLLGGELEVGGMKDFGSGLEKLGFEFRKKFGGPKGERVKRKEGGGMSRRKFMKIMGGLAALPIVGKFFKSAKPVAKVADVVTKTTKGTQPPEYFFDLAAKIKILGKESSIARQERMVEVNYKNYTLEEDLVTGDMTIVKRKVDPEFGYEEEVMALRKGQADEMTKGKTPPDEYEELTVRPDPDGKMKDVEDGIEPESIQEIVEEVVQGGGNLDQRTLEEIARGRLASGGVAMMLGE